MSILIPQNCIAFAGHRCVDKGESLQVASSVKQFVDNNPETNVLIFNQISSQPVEIDLRGPLDDVLEKVKQRLIQTEPEIAEPSQPKKAGRPKLGVKAREVTLLPKHWQWLSEQPGSASVTLRKLVQKAMSKSQGKQNKAQTQESIYRFINAIAGNEIGFEEVTRVLYADDKLKLEQLIAVWPVDIKAHILFLYNNQIEV